MVSETVFLSDMKHYMVMISSLSIHLLKFLYGVFGLVTLIHNLYVED